MTLWLQRQLRRLWTWWRFTPPPSPGQMSERWLIDHSYRSGHTH